MASRTIEFGTRVKSRVGATGVVGVVPVVAVVEVVGVVGVVEVSAWLLSASATWRNIERAGWSFGRVRGAGAGMALMPASRPSTIFRFGFALSFMKLAPRC